MLGEGYRISDLEILESVHFSEDASSPGNRAEVSLCQATVNQLRGSRQDLSSQWCQPCRTWHAGEINVSLRVLRWTVEELK